MYINVDGVRLFFDVEGAKLVPDGPTMREKPTLLLLHGGPGFDHSSYKPAFARFADLAQVVYLDHRGNGRSDRSTTERWTLAQWGDDVRAFCDALGIEKPIVMGQSFGGFVAIAYATRHPDHPGGLILSSTSARHRLDRVLATFERLGGSAAREAARRYWQEPGPHTMQEYVRLCFPLYNRTQGDPESLSRTVWNFDVMYHFGAGEDLSFDFLADLGRVHCPTLVLGGEQDPITPIEDQADIAAAIPPQYVRFERFAACGHGVFRDNPDRAFGVIEEFLGA
ncbi:alpha/beta hydrolase [Candidatus Binatia bacterium]|nr:alpha/beta hydrolase [Candidatus Binatia bacterium]